MTQTSADNSGRLTEISDILAAGLLRLRDRKSSLISMANPENPLDFEPGQNGDVSCEFEEIDT
jgi:hypothetical protein